MKLKILFWGLGYVIKRNFKKFEKFSELFKENSLDFAMSVKDTNIGRRFKINAEEGAKSTKDIAKAELKIIFATKQDANEILTSKDKNAFMRGIQDGKIEVQGDFNKIPFLQKAMSKIRF